MGPATMLAQGLVNFSTTPVGVRVYEADGTTPLAGTKYLAQLYYYPLVPSEPRSLPLGSPVNFRSGNYAGYVQTSGTTSLGQTCNPIVTVNPDLTAPSQAILQMKVWSSEASSYEEAVAKGLPCGVSTPFTVTLTPGVVVNLTGLTSFTAPQSISPQLPTSLAITRCSLDANHHLFIQCNGYNGFGGILSFQVQTNSTLDGSLPWVDSGSPIVVASSQCTNSIPISTTTRALFYRVRCSMY